MLWRYPDRCGCLAVRINSSAWSLKYSQGTTSELIDAFSFPVVEENWKTRASGNSVLRCWREAAPSFPALSFRNGFTHVAMPGLLKFSPWLCASCCLGLLLCSPKTCPGASVVTAKETQRQFFVYKKLQSTACRRKNPSCVLVSEWAMDRGGAARGLFPGQACAQGSGGTSDLKLLILIWGNLEKTSMLGLPCVALTLLP